MKLFTVLFYLRRFYETNDLANGLYYNKYTFEQKSRHYLYVTIYKQKGEISIINKKARMLDDFTKESLIDFLSNDLAYAEKKKIIKETKKLNKFETNLLRKFSTRYNRFMAELPILII